MAQLLTAMIIPLAVVASGGGHLMSGLYRDAPGVIPAIRGQDLVTLITCPILAVVLVRARRGRARATIVWIGLLSYLLYVYTGAAFAYRFNEFFLLYLILFSLSLAALIAVTSSINTAEIAQRFAPSAPRRPVAFFLAFIALMLVISELGQIIPALSNNEAPELIQRSEGMGNFVYVLDLGVVVPVAVLSARWLWRRAPWGYVVGGCMLIKAITMGTSLLAATWLSVRAGLPLDPGSPSGMEPLLPALRSSPSGSCSAAKANVIGGLPP